MARRGATRTTPGKKTRNFQKDAPAQKPKCKKMKLKHAQIQWYSRFGTAKWVQPNGYSRGCGKIATCAYQVVAASASALRDAVVSAQAPRPKFAKAALLTPRASGPAAVSKLGVGLKYTKKY